MQLLQYSKLQDISDDHKIKTFDRLYRMCLNHTKQIFSHEGDCDVDCDCPHYIFEKAMMSCLGENIFDQLNTEEEFKIDD